jgi:hypothetical protein
MAGLPLSCRICRILMDCGVDEAERFKRFLGKAVLDNETAIESEMFCLACMAEVKAYPVIKEEKKPPLQGGVETVPYTGHFSVPAPV